MRLLHCNVTECVEWSIYNLLSLLYRPIKNSLQDHVTDHVINHVINSHLDDENYSFDLELFNIEKNRSSARGEAIRSLEVEEMSLTLNISKEAKLFYKNERRIKECSEARTMQPTTTIHMKKHSPPNRIDAHPTLFGHDDEQSDDECLMEDDVIKRRQVEAWRKTPRKAPPSDPRTLRYSFKDIKRHTHFSDNDNFDSFSKRQKRGKRGGMEKWAQDRIREPHHQKEKQKHLGGDKSEIPSRDLNGDGNDSDEMGDDTRSDNMSIANDTSQAQDISHYDDDLRDIDKDENNISENNPFARQRVLKSKYKNMYST